MAAVTVNTNQPPSSGTSLTTAVQLVTPGVGVDFIDFIADANCYLVIDPTATDGAAIGTLKRFLIPANTIYPIPVGPHSVPVGVAAVSGTATGYFLGIGR